MHRTTNWLLALGAALGAGCVSLGPTPGMTFNSAVPASRPGAELSASLVPGYYLSSAVTQPSAAQPQWGSPILQLSLLIDPATLLGNSGFSGGFRVLSGTDGYLEPELRYRRSFLDLGRLSVGATLSGMYVRYQDSNALRGISYRAGRGTLEAGAELRLTPPGWFELRAIGGGSATVLGASGTWCADPDSAVPIVCPSDGNATLEVSGSARGAFLSGYGGLAADGFRPQSSFFQFARVAAVVAAGAAPAMVPVPPQPGLSESTSTSALQGGSALWAYWGASVTIAFGAPGESPTSPFTPEPAPVPPRSTRARPPDAGPANVRGQVRGPGGAPLAGATVQVMEAHLTERTGEHGDFQIHVPAGRYTVRFEAEGMVPQTKNVKVTAGEQALFFVDLAPAAP